MTLLLVSRLVIVKDFIWTVITIYQFAKPPLFVALSLIWIIELRVFLQIFWLGDLFSGTIYGPRQGRSHGGGLLWGRSQIRGNLEKLSAKVKNAPPPTAKLVNFGVLHIK